MTHVSTGQLTIADIHDLTYALLSSDAGLVPVDVAGTPKTPLSTSPLTTQMSVYKGNVLQTGWAFSRTQSNATSSVNSSTGVLTVTGISTDSAYVDITASKSGEPSLVKRFPISKVYQGETGETGPTGPAGTPGYLGLYADGSTLHLKGYASDGTLSASSGYIYPSGSNRVLVPAASLALTGTGQGHVLFNASWGTSVQFARLVSDTSLRWEPYNGGSALDVSGNTFVVGSFSRDSSVTGMRILDPVRLVADFYRERFLEILASGTYTDLDTLASAMGLEQMLTRLGAIEAFFGSIFANAIRMSRQGVIESSNFAQSGGMPTAGFRLESSQGLIQAVAALLRSASILDAVISGQTTLECSDGETLFKTQYGTAGSVSLTAPAKARWAGSAACAAVSLGSSGAATVNGSSASYDSYFRSNAANPFHILNRTSAGSYSHTVVLAGRYKISCQASVTLGAGTSYYTVVINSTQVAASGSGIGTYTYDAYHDLSAGDTVAITLSGTYPCFGKLMVETDAVCVHKGATNAVTALLLVCNSALAYNLTLTLGALFNSAASKTLASIDTWYNGLSDGQALGCTSSSLVTVAGTQYTAKYLVRIAGLLRVITTGGATLEFSAPAGSSDPADAGWHDIAGTLYIAGETRGLLVGSLIPVGSGKNAGEPSNRFSTGYFTTLDAPTVNSTTVAATTVNATTLNGALGTFPGSSQGHVSNTSSYQLPAVAFGVLGIKTYYTNSNNTTRTITAPSGGTWGYAFHHSNSYYSSGNTDVNFANTGTVSGGSTVATYKMTANNTSGILLYWRIS